MTMTTTPTPPRPREARTFSLAGFLESGGLRQAAVIGAAIAIAAVIGAALAAASGASPIAAAQALWTGMVGSGFSVGTAANRIAVLLAVGVGFTVAMRAGLVNVGGEGQIAVGALAATAVGTTLPPQTPPIAAVLCVLIAGAIGGALFAAIPAWLKTTRGTSEVITSLLLNFVGLGLVSLAVHETALLRQPITSAATLPQSLPLIEAARLPMLQAISAPATVAVIISLFIAAITLIVLRFGTIGLNLTAVGLSPAASARLGLSVNRVMVQSFMWSGATAGLAGGFLVASAPFVLADGVSSGLGFSGLVVGLLGRGSILGVTAAAIGIGFLTTGGLNLQLEAHVPATTVSVIQSVLIICVAGAARFAAVRSTRGSH